MAVVVVVAEQIQKLPFAMWIQVGTSNHVLCGGPDHQR